MLMLTIVLLLSFGSYVRASWPIEVWKNEAQAERIIMFFIPYFHFSTMWGSFVGYTAMPNRKFTSAQASLSQDELAIGALATPPNLDGFGNSSFADQGSMFITKRSFNNDYLSTKRTCPLANRSDFPLFCEDMFDCGYATDPGNQGGAPSVVDTIGYLVALSITYLLMAGYWATVFSRGNGKGGPFYFFLLPGYWFMGKVEPPSDIDGDSRGVVFDNTKKSYGRVEVLKGVSFKMNPGEVTALLGHNGAGKTSLSNILCCETPGTGGDIRVFGHSVSQKPYIVRNMVGLCRQDDYLWPNLSAKEHLELFAGLRGVDNSSLEATVQKWLASVDLDGVQGQYSSAFSGGMKRRLSLALATIGDRPLIVLDEVCSANLPWFRNSKLTFPF
jgi:ABC-type lipoprotein export system ATPase subunit